MESSCKVRACDLAGFAPWPCCISMSDPSRVDCIRAGVQGKSKGPGKATQPAKKVIHPKSREAKRQNRQMVRSEHLSKKKNDHAQILHTKRTCWLRHLSLASSVLRVYRCTWMYWEVHACMWQVLCESGREGVLLWTQSHSHPRSITTEHPRACTHIVLPRFAICRLASIYTHQRTTHRYTLDYTHAHGRMHAYTIHTHTHTHTHAHAHRHTQHTRTCARAHTYTHLCTHAHTHARTQTPTHARTQDGHWSGSTRTWTTARLRTLTRRWSSSSNSMCTSRVLRDGAGGGEGGGRGRSCACVHASMYTQGNAFASCAHVRVRNRR